MDLERWKKIEDIFQAALDREADERAGFIRAECGGDNELCAEVEKLVARYETEENFLESPVWTDSLFLGNTFKNRVAESLEEEILPPRTEKSFAGRKIGVYLLTEQIGRGGMGVVYAAQRADGEFSQKVAVKLIKRGMDTDFIVRRFRHERQILASLNHPNIARLLDGGTTDDGAPYFIMEFIEGAPFFKYCEAQNLDLRARLRLFLAVCAAISHAHGRKIIHRDIKPGNILVSDEGTPKLLDFGIAKILDPDLIHESVAPTATQMRLMTPEYASPEQVRGDEITPASDQYSLGALLYELVTGERPYKFPSRAPHEIARIICEEIPTNPTSAENLSESKQPRLNLISNDDFGKKLDRIILKSLRKNPLQRYVSVREFAADIERLLKDQTIRAEEFEPASKISETPGKQLAVAVLPFKNLNNAPDEETGGGSFLGIGLADALITRLSNIQRILVRPTSSVLRFGARDGDSFAAGKELNVGFVLEGSILYAQNRIRVSIQLLDVSAQKTIWAERFDEGFTDVLSLEDTISAKVAESLTPHLTGAERQRLEKRGTNNSDAHEAYLRGRFYWNSFTEEGFRQAKLFYEKAIRLDPNYALAYAGLTDYYLWLGAYAMLPPKDCFPPAREAAEKAVALDNESAEAHSALGFARLCDGYDWERSEQSALRALELNPNYISTYIWYSSHHFGREKYEEGLQMLRRAIKLDPLSYQSHNSLAYGLYFARRFDEAIAKAEENIENFPVFSLPYNALGHFLSYVGRGEESLKAADRALELSTDLDRMPTLFERVFALAAAEKKSEARELLGEIESQAGEKHISPREYIIAYSYLGEKEKALQALEKSFADGELLIWLKSEPAIDIIRDDPRYRAVLAKINLPFTEKAAILAESPPTETNAVPNEFEQKEIAKKPSLFVKFWYALPIAALAAIILYLIINILSHTSYSPESTPPAPPTPPQVGGQ
ncbi:MAG TPA: protein kinase [Pyrinomonadaceae bacterium]|nr:protein kinase [Pyrinomonadaceae bacterium]